MKSYRVVRYDTKNGDVWFSPERRGWVFWYPIESWNFTGQLWFARSFKWRYQFKSLYLYKTFEEAKQIIDKTKSFFYKSKLAFRRVVVYEE